MNDELELLAKDLQIKLGIGWDISVFNHRLLEINAPMTNEIGDNYQLFIEKKADDKYSIGDDVNSIGDFDMYGLSTKQAYAFLKRNHIQTYKEEVIIYSTKAALVENIHKIMRIEAGLTAIQQLEEIKNEEKARG